MTEHPLRLTPEEDEDQAEKAVALLERLLDAVAVAFNTRDREAWIAAARAADECRYQCLAAAGQEFRRWAQAKEAAGLYPCSRCREWVPRETMTKDQIVWGSGEKEKTSTRYLCPVCKSEEEKRG